MSDDPHSFQSEPRAATGEDRVTFGDGDGWFLAQTESVTVEDGSVVPVTDPATVIDRFEDGDVAEYTQNGSGSFSASTARVWEGSYAVELQQGGSTKVFSSPGEGLGYYPRQGDVIEWYVDHDYVETSQTGVVFGSNGDPSNWTEGYACLVEANANNSDFEVRLYSREGGGTRVSIGDYRDEWLRGRFEWRSDSTVAFELYRTNASTNRSDHTLIESVTYDATGENAHDNRSFGFFANNFGDGGRRSRAFYDDVRASEGSV